MDPSIINTIISLISGIIGGNIAGAALPEDKNLGAVGNSVAGIVGGGIGGYILQAFNLFSQTAATGGLDVGSILAQIGSGGVGGAVVMIVVGLLKGLVQKPS